MEKIADLRKLDIATLQKKIIERKKEIYENKQKHLRGEIKDVSIFKKLRKSVAQLYTVLAEQQKKQEEKK